MVISEMLRHLTRSLRDNARFEAEHILMSVLGIDRTELILNPDRSLSDAEQRKISEYAERRKSGEPLWYILGECEFMGFPFKVKRGVLIPRQDTETLVEAVLAELKEGDNIADICAGSGCIGISLARIKNINSDLLEISDMAIDIERENIEINAVSDRVKIIKTDILNEYPAKMYDALISNPPYIESDVIDTLETEVKDFEPRIALDGGNDGLKFYRRITEIAPKILKKGGFIAFEIGYNQAEAVSELMAHNFYDISVIKDICGNYRVIKGFLK